MPVHIAAVLGHVSVVDHCCCLGDASPRASDERSSTPLHFAAYLDVVRLFNIFAKSTLIQLY